MKKIYILLFSFFILNSSLYSYSFTSNPPNISSNNTWILNIQSSMHDNLSGHCANLNAFIGNWASFSNSYNAYRIASANDYYNNGNKCGIVFDSYNSVTSSSCVAPNVIDPVTHVCAPFVLPTCTATQFLSDNNKTCIDNTVQSQSSSNGVTEYEYLNGDYQICDTAIQSCATYDKNGKKIANIPINGTTYNTLTGTLVVKAMKVGGVVLSAIAGGIAIVGSVGTAGLAPAAAAAVASFTATYGTLSMTSLLGLTGTAYLGDNPYIENTLSNDNLASTAKGIKVNLSNMDFSKESPKVSKSVDPATGATVSTLSQSDGTTTSVKEDTTNVTVTQTKPTGEVHEVVIPKTTLTTPPVTNDFTEQNNIQDFTYKETVTPPPVINNDGSVTTPAKQTYTHSLTSTNQNTVTSSTTVANTATQTPSATTAPTQTTSTTTDSTGLTSTTTTDSKAITERLNTLIRQTTKANGDRKTTNDLLSQIHNTNELMQTALHNINSDTSSINTEMVSANSKLSKIDTQTKDIRDDLRAIKGSISDTGNSASTFDSVIQEFTKFKDNIASQYDSILSQATSLKSSLSNGFVNNLPTAIVTTCPYTSNVEFVGKTIPLNIDVCNVLSPVYSTTYFMFYILFFAGFTIMTFNILINTRST